jgi:predicted  nucleic acid-binding Zn-ribbon protein
MEEAEPVGEQEGRLVEQRTALVAEAARHAADAAGSEAEIDEEIAGVEAQRDGLVAAVPPALLGEYERLRARLGGEGVARLDGNRCTGCHLTLPAVEVEAVRRAPSGSVPHHEECGRILVPS